MIERNALKACYSRHEKQRRISTITIRRKCGLFPPTRLTQIGQPERAQGAGPFNRSRFCFGVDKN